MLSREPATEIFKINIYFAEVPADFYKARGQKVYSGRKNMGYGYVHSIETFGSVDGPGIRFVIFLTGCNMRCQFCHNPDTWALEGGTEYTAEELISKALRYRSYWGDTGGITVSGGEPLLQIDFVTELFAVAKENGINTCLDTSGQPFTREEPFFGKFAELLRHTDLVMLDIKHMDDEKHRILTGHGNGNILDCARYMDSEGQKMWLRHVLVSGGDAASDEDTQLKRLAEFIKTLNNVEKVEVLPYHTFGVHKWEKLGIPYRLKGVEPPAAERVESAKRILGID